MAAGGQPYLGVTPPISTDPPSERHKQITETLMAQLRAMNQFESAEDARLREVVLSKLNTIIKEFVYKVSKMRKFSDTMAKEAGGKIFTFGSYRLGVHGPGADIDTLAVVPRHVTRDDFFKILEPSLKARPEVEDCTGVPDAWVPIITMKFSGVEIDLLFASLNIPSVPDDLDLRSNELLKNLDEKAQRSLNGSRVTDEILRLVPNVLVFRDALRTIKVWAKRRGIYSNVMGFCGGVVWAMLVARICQLYPNECAGGIISKFFIILHQWNWPTPIMLKLPEDGPLHVRVWNPNLYPSDRAHRMPVITPAYPAMCSTHNVSQSTQAIMTKEFKRAADIVDKIVVRDAQWADLFEPVDFFSKYRYYLQITASSVDSDVQLKWSGTVASKIRLLVKQLEYVDTLELAHPYVDSFDRVNYCLTSEESHTLMTGELPPDIAARTKEEYENKPGILKVYTSSYFIGLMVEPKDPNSKVARKLDIAYPTSEFTKLVKSWDKFEQDKMGIVVRHVKASALPLYCRSSSSGAGGKAKGKSLKRAKSGKSTANANGATTVETNGSQETSPAKRLRPSQGALDIPNATSLEAPADVPSSVPSDGAAGTPAAASGPTGFPLIDSMKGNGGTQTPTTPQTESAMTALQNLRTSTPAGTPATTSIPGNSLPGSVLPSAGSLNSAAVAQQQAQAQAQVQEQTAAIAGAKTAVTDSVNAQASSLEQNGHIASEASATTGPGTSNNDATSYSAALQS